ncbi:MAG: hypothetical protein Kow0063_38250 [Anaerolineae bacterium]
MSSPKVSVIIPSYNGADFIGEAIRSVLDQTYQNFELIIVDDASQDHTPDVIGQFDDPRIKYLAHEVNQGPDAARRLAIGVSSGDILAFLDQDDLFHPEKLQAHVTLLESSPEIGFTYNSRFELNHSASTIREIWRPPQKVTLADLILGFPISPSDMVVRREWSKYLDLTKEPPLIHGGEYVITGRLFMSGCRFASIDRALNYRRYHSGRTFSKLSARCEAELSAQQRVFSDPRCPAEVLALRDTAFMNTYRIWAYYALAQGDTAIGQEYIRKAVELKPSLVAGNPSELVNFLMTESIADESVDHGALLKSIFDQLPPELSHLSNQYGWAVGRGYLLRGARAVMWGRPDAGREHFQQAARWEARIDEAFLRLQAYHLMNYETEFGAEATQAVLQSLAAHLEKIGNRSDVRWLKGCYSANQAFSHYQAGEYVTVPGRVIRAIVNDPQYLLNRGMLSILVRSAVGRWVGYAHG